MTKNVILIFFVVSVNISALMGQTDTYQINWPDKYEPQKAKFFVHNEIFIEASAKEIWDILIQAETWPNWYEGAFNVKVINSNDGKLDSNSVFTWKTMGLNFKSTITEFEPPHRLSWESEKKSIQGYHAWLIIPTENGCRVITDESQHGFLTFLQKVFQPNKLHRLHDIWLMEIKNKAEANKEGLL
jgi:uncharacterized protein YndB with AHSA1/START domain